MKNEPENVQMSPDDGAATVSKPFLAQVLLYLGIGGTPGALAVLIATGIEKGFDWPLLLLCAGFAIGGLLLIRYALKIGNFDPPGLTSKTGRNQLILLVSAVLGVVIGVYFNLTGKPEQVLNGTFTLSPTEGIVGLLILVAFIPVAYFWHQGADEHEKAASSSAATVTVYAYFYGYIGWTLASYANLLPPVNDFGLFMAVLFTFLGIWAFKRSG